jgi:hypothetical protein
MFATVATLLLVPTLFVVIHGRRDAKAKPVGEPDGVTGSEAYG